MQRAHASPPPALLTAAAPPATAFAAVSPTSVGRAPAADALSAADNESSVRRGHGGTMPPPELEVAALGDDISAAMPPVRAIDKERIALFVRRGEDFIAAGDFVGAGVVFRHAAELGDARGALIRASTYDPNPLDFAKAPFLVRSGDALGPPESSRRLEPLAGRTVAEGRRSRRLVNAVDRPFTISSWPKQPFSRHKIAGTICAICNIARPKRHVVA